MSSSSSYLMSSHSCPGRSNRNSWGHEGRGGDGGDAPGRVLGFHTFFILHNLEALIHLPTTCQPWQAGTPDTCLWIWVLTLQGPVCVCVCVCVRACLWGGYPPSNNALSLEIGPGGDRREDRGAQLWSSFPSMSWTQVPSSPSSGPLGFCKGQDHGN